MKRIIIITSIFLIICLTMGIYGCFFIDNKMLKPGNQGSSSINDESSIENQSSSTIVNNDDNDRSDNQKYISDIVIDRNTIKSYVGSQFLIDTSSGEEETFYYDSRIELLLYDNNKYWLTDSNAGSTQAYEGNYSIEGDTLTLNPKVWHHSRGSDYNVENDERHVEKYKILNGRIINIDSKKELYLTYESELHHIVESINRVH